MPEDLTLSETKPLSILFICNKSPWPAREGGPIAMNNLIEGLADAGHLVKVLAINTNKYSVKPADIPAEYHDKTHIELDYIDLSIKPVAAFLNLFTAKSYHVERFISNDFDRKLREVLTRDCYDIVQIETLFMSPYLSTIRELSSAKIVLRAHNIEHRIWKRVASISKNLLKKVYLNHLSSTLERYEKEIIKDYDGVVPISSFDAPFFTNHTNHPVMALPTGIDPNRIPEIKTGETEHALFHIGAMNWMPNEEGIKWFIDQVWPEVHAELPDLKLYIAGREMPSWLSNLHSNQIEVVGEVEDAWEFIQSKSILIAPLFSGSGIRIKIIESMAMGKVVISTTIGAEGINYTNGLNILIADDATEFAEAVKKLYCDPGKTKAIGMEAQKLIRRDHNTPKIIEQLVGFYRNIL
ncbi:MAG: glycosyltransferase family 4 protein [Bacteroidales bacterium]|nr:glycosyltransferase family 4 protein [Bacteroidales bacterium]